MNKGRATVKIYIRMFTCLILGLVVLGLPNIADGAPTTSRSPQSTFAIPASGVMGWMFSEGGFHYGIDIWATSNPNSAPPGNNVYAAYPGTIVHIYYEDRTSSQHPNPWPPTNPSHSVPLDSRASIIVISHVGLNHTPFFSLYLHMANDDQSATYINPSLRVGDSVTSGQYLGRMGNWVYDGWTDKITHLHFEINSTGNSADCKACAWDPSSYLGFDVNYANILQPGHIQEGNTFPPPGGNTGCAGPSLNSPTDGQVLTSQTNTFSWNAVSGCQFNGYTLHVKDTSNMDSGGNIIVDVGEGSTSHTSAIDSQWNNKDLYWGVRAANAPNGANWSVRRFRIQPGSNCNNSSDQITLYANTNYQGTCKVLGVGDYPDPGSMGFPNDSAQSIRVGGNVQAILCHDNGYAGGCATVASDTSDLNSTSLGNNQLSSLHVQTKSSCSNSNPNSDQVVIFADTGFNGNCVTLGLGDYPDPSALGNIGNDNAESIRVGSNVQAVLCHDNNYGGGCATVTSDVDNLDNTSLGRNQLSSVHVQNRQVSSPDPQQEGAVSVSGTLVRGNTVYITINVKNYGNIATPAMHPYVEGNNSAGQFWRADGSQPGSAIIQPGQTVAFQVQQDLASSGTWTASGIYLWNNDAGTYWKALPANGQNQQFNFTVTDPPPSTPSSPNPSDGAQVDRTNDTTFSWNTNGSLCDIHIWGGPNINTTQTGVSCSGFHWGSQWPGTYQWQVTAYNGAGSVRGPAWNLGIKPTPPTALSATAASPSQIDLTWTQSSDDPGSVDNYRVYAYFAALITTLPGGTTSYSVVGLNCGTTYTFFVTAVRMGIASDTSNFFSVSTQPCPLPSALFTANPINGPAPLSVRFTDQSTGNINSWSWNFGDGGASSAQSPSHTYNPGQYTVGLTVSGPGGSNTSTKANYITVAIPCYGLVTTAYPLGAGTFTQSPLPTCNGNTQYISGTVVTITPTPNSGYHFWYWSDGVPLSDNASVSVTMDNSKSVGARFEACLTVAANSSPVGGGSVNLDPQPNCAGGTQYIPGTLITLTANANSGYNFLNWTGGITATTNPSSWFFSSSASVTANFTPAVACYPLGVAVSPNGAGRVIASPTPNCGSQYASGTIVQITATANSGYTFTNWSGDTSGSSFTTTITMNGNKNAAANFAQTCFPAITSVYAPPIMSPGNVFWLVWTIGGTGCSSVSHTDIRWDVVSRAGLGFDAYAYSTTVQTGPPGDFWTNLTAPASGTFYLAVEAQVDSVPAITQTEYTITIEPCYPLTTVISPTNSGTVVGSPDANCNYYSPQQYPAGTAVQLYAYPYTGYDFAGWAGDASGASNPITVTMASTKTITAMFSPIPVPSNDDFAAAKVISTTPYSDTEDTRLATNAADDPVYPCNMLIRGYATVWYQFTPATNGLLKANTIGSSYHTQIAVWTGVRGSLVNVNCSADYYGDYQTKLQTNVTGSVPYYLEIADWVGWDPRHLKLSVDFTPCYTLTVVPNPNSAGTASASPLPNCGSQYLAGTVVTLTSTANSGYAFTNWSGGAVGPANPITLTMNSNQNVTANFVSAVAADFSAIPTVGWSPFSSQFTDLSIGGPTTWSWTFGDGGTSLLQNPSHTYSSTGTYTVSLTVSNTGGTNNRTKANYVSVIAAPGAISLAAGGSDTCASINGWLKCWGNNFFGQMGNGTTIDSHTPGDVSGLTSGVSTIAAGGEHTCALMVNGGLKCWGYNNAGELGDGTTTQRLVPVDIGGLNTGMIAVSSGLLHTCALTNGGGVKCWGWNAYGQLGDGTTTQRLVPVDVNGLSSGVVAISLGDVHSCALTAAGGVKCWGSNSNGQLGDGTTTSSIVPVDVVGLSNGVVAISAGTEYTCALINNGGVKCWGYNWAGQLGDGTTTQQLTPVDVSGLTSGAIAITTGYAHTCALMNTGGAKCWGYNADGELGDGTITDHHAPGNVVGLNSVLTSIANGSYHTCGLTSGGNLKCWGDNNNGQLGDGTTSQQMLPVDVFGFPGSCYSLNVTVNPSAGGSAVPIPTPNCNNGMQYTPGAVVTLTASTNTGYLFNYWGGDALGPANPITVTMNIYKNVTANFAACSTLTTGVNPSGTGIVSVSPPPNCGNQYASGTAVTLTVNPNPGYALGTWSFDGSYGSSSNPTFVSMYISRIITATLGVSPLNDDFAAAKVMGATPYSDTVDTTYASSAGDDPVFTCGSRDQGSRSIWYKFTPGSNGRLNANTIGSNYDTMLGLWAGSRGSLTSLACDDDSGGNLTSLVQANLSGTNTYYLEVARYSTDQGGPMNLSVNFTPCYSLLTSVSPNGAGIISSSLPPNCGGQYASGTVVSLTASANTGYTVTNWSGDAVGPANAITVTMSSGKNITANFASIQTGSVVMAINPMTTSISVGQVFSITVQVQAGAQSEDGAAAYLNFDPALLQVANLAPGIALPIVLQNSFSNTVGLVNYAAGNITPPPISGTFTLVTIAFNPLTSTTGTTITFGSVAPRQSDVTFGGNSVLSSTQNSAVVINSNNAVIAGGVTLQGRPLPPDPRWSTTLTVSLTSPGGSSPVYIFNPSTDYSGHFTLTNIIPGVYTARIKQRHTLQNMLVVTLTNGTNPLDFGALREGDANGDNFVTLPDFSILATTFGKCQGSISYDNRADFNEDGCATLLDFSLLATDFGQAGPAKPTGVRANRPTRSVQLVVDPPTQTVASGQLFTVSVLVETGAQQVDGAAAYLDFDPTLLKIQQLTGGTSLPIPLTAQYSNSAGTIDYAAGTFSNFPSGTFTLMQIQFQALTETTQTTGTLSYHFGAPRDSDVTFQGTSVRGSTSNGAIVVLPVKPEFHLYLPIIARSN